MSVLTKPYPRNESLKRKVFVSLIFGNFIFIFLFLFQPFGLDQWQVNNKALRLFGYGIITGGVVLINSVLPQLIFRNWFKEQNWKVWKEIVWALWNIVVIGTFNLLYTHWQIGFELSFLNFLNYQWITLVIGIFPVSMITLFNHNRLQTRNLNEAREITEVIEAEPLKQIQHEPEEILSLTAENSKDNMELNIESLYYIESADNYIQVVYIGKTDVEKKLIRNTLKNIEEQVISSPHLFRCHRSYLVNLKKVLKVSGNSQGYKLHLENMEEPIPVSRSLNDIIREKIEEIHPKTKV